MSETRNAGSSSRTRLAAIVSADVTGYSRLMGRDESGTLATLKALRQEVVDPAIAEHGGRIVKTTSDGLLLEFRAWSMPARSPCRSPSESARRERGRAILAGPDWHSQGLGFPQR